jgi:hypothetical protein
MVSIAYKNFDAALRKQSYRPSGQSGHFGNTTINSVNGADIANTVEVMYGVDCDIKLRCGSSKQSYDQVVKVVILAIQQSTLLMVPILPTQLRSCMVSIAYITRCGSSKKSYRPSGQSGHFGNTTINSVNGADIANTVEVMYGVDCDIKLDAALRKQSYRPSRQSGHFGNTTINSVNGADIANTVEVMYGVDCDIKLRCGSSKKKL